VEQEKEARKRMSRIGPQERTKQSRPWPLREFSGKPVWDWLQLVSVLAIPVVLAAVGLYVEAQLSGRQQQLETQRARRAQEIEDQRAKRQLKIEGQRAKIERGIEEQRAQDEALQAYLDQTSQLLLEKGLRNAQPNDAASVVTRARSLTILGRVDGARKRSVLLFLYESGLLHKGDKLVVDLSGADLSGAELNGAHLPSVDFSGPTYSYSDQLRHNDQTAATLPDVDLSDSELRGAVLTGADLSGTDLSGADLTNALVTEEQLYQAKSLNGATMPNGQKYEE
jgi:uncharacterized protein YjbI with pentapeptide repeats